MKLLLLSLTLTCTLVGFARPVHKDVSPIDKAFIGKLSDGRELRIDALAPNLFRIRKAWTNCWTESGMNRYGIIQHFADDVANAKRLSNGLETTAATVSLNAEGKVQLISKVSSAKVQIEPRTVKDGFNLRFSLTPTERIYGLGDSFRENIMRRGGKYDIWIRNNLCNIPIPMTISSEGWGMLLNSTWRNAFDVGKAEPNIMNILANEGDIDTYLFVGKDYHELLDIYTQLTGRSALLPIWGYGFTFVANQNIDQFNVINECMQFRDHDLPCDVYGLEPGWMQKFYDYSIYKEWNKQRFYFPYWAPKSKVTWISAMKRIGMKLSLWLCCDYDLTRYEEQCYAGTAKKSGHKVDLSDTITETWEDDRIGRQPGAKVAVPQGVHKDDMYKLLYCPENDCPNGMLPWFEHLKKFVDQGVQCFKLDGSNQFGEHPDRAWANGMTDEEMHNLYSDIYDKQMARGYEDYTSRRAMVYSAGGYVGVQQFVATWAGDTGGGALPLASLLNLAASGHSNQSCDMSIFNIESLHFGFLQTWSQQNNWDYWHQPWLQEPEQVAIFRKYAHLRYRLLPYLYTAAAKCSRTGWPVMRMLPLEYPEILRYDQVATTYLLGPDLLVSAFAPQVEIPPGIWYEWRTGTAVTGPQTLPVKIEKDWGGSLYVRAGAIIPMWPVKQHVEHGWNEVVELHVWPGTNGKAELYEDDGISLKYRSGGGTLIPLMLEGKKLTIGVRVGADPTLPKAHTYTIVVHEGGQERRVPVGEVDATESKIINL